MLTDIMNDLGLEPLVHFPTREKIYWIYSLPRQFQDIHSPDELSDHDIVAGTLKIVILLIKKPRRKLSPKVLVNYPGSDGSVPT